MTDTSPVVGLAEWIGALRTELRRAQQTADAHDIHFVVGPVELELEIATTRETGASGEVKFWVVGAAGSGRHVGESRQRITLSLTPEVPDGTPVKVGDQLDRQPR
ncbi:trypco2 family protein [Streptomyces sp. NPDC001941]|uniref:trypco2 family protein n=1 Tax=Streptomyces sp. NPDC001941 TaxID=3154659 RepID=UPI003318E09E